LADGGAVSLDPPAYLQFPSQDFDRLIDGLDGGGEVRVRWIIPPCGVKPFSLGGKGIYFILHSFCQPGKLFQVSMRYFISSLSQLQALGVDMETIQSMVGHADIEMTQHYLHVQEEVRQAAAEKFSKTFKISHSR